MSAKHCWARNMCESNDGGDGGGSAGGIRQNRNHDGNKVNPSMTPNRTNLSADQAVSIANNPFSPHNKGQIGEGILAAAQPIIPGGIPLGAARTFALMNDNKRKAGTPSPNDSGSSSNPKRAVAGKVKANSKETAPLAKDIDDDLGGDEAVLAPSRKRSNRQSTMLTGSQGIRGRANIGRTLLGA
tara:strand:+ start:217 stop:771 length:555 start_codon:yes stop_codon:yes gene_type:complete